MCMCVLCKVFLYCAQPLVYTLELIVYIYEYRYNIKYVIIIYDYRYDIKYVIIIIGMIYNILYHDITSYPLKQNISMLTYLNHSNYFIGTIMI